ncbi:MAG: Rrf2 family transcriptional regulator [Syntrophobacteraceae bacterium]
MRSRHGRKSRKKYLSNIIPPLKSAGLIHAMRGAQGGYVLARHPREITLKDILLVLEGSMCLVECSEQPRMCERSNECLMRDVWSEVSGRMMDALNSFTLEFLVEKQKLKEKVAFYKARRQLFFRGRTPVTPSLPYPWYETPNLHFLSISDFTQYCADLNIRIEQRFFLNDNGRVHSLPNLLAQTAIFLISR